jgi:hypothetical protein
LLLRLTKIISQNQVQKKLESTVVYMGRKDGIGNGRIFSARQYQFTTGISKEKVQIRDKFARRCFFIAVSLRKKPQKSVKKPQNRCFPR